MSTASLHRQMSARPALILGVLGVVLLIGGVVGWSLLAPVSSAVIASGRVAVADRNQSIEHVYGGEVIEVLVRNGDRVSRGDTLVRFAGSSLSGELQILQEHLTGLDAQAVRLDAERSGVSELAWTEELAELAAASAGAAATLASEEAAFSARLAVHLERTSLLREQVSQARQEASALAVESASLLEQRSRIETEIDAATAAHASDSTDPWAAQTTALRQSATQIDIAAAQNAAALARTRGVVAELESELLEMESSRAQRAEDLLRDLRIRHRELQTRQALVHSRLARLEVRATADGIVLGMTVNGPGDVVRPGETMLHIVPDTSSLVVIAEVSPRDVDQIYVGQEAVILFPAFPLRTTPQRVGRVLKVSADAITDNRSGASWFEAELDIDSSAGVGAPAAAGADDLPLVPGMPAEVQIQTGSRSIASYLVRPLTDFFGRSLREE